MHSYIIRMPRIFDLIKNDNVWKNFYPKYYSNLFLIDKYGSNEYGSKGLIYITIDKTYCQ